MFMEPEDQWYQVSKILKPLLVVTRVVAFRKAHLAELGF